MKYLKKYWEELITLLTPFLAIVSTILTILKMIDFQIGILAVFAILIIGIIISTFIIRKKIPSKIDNDNSSSPFKSKNRFIALICLILFLMLLIFWTLFILDLNSPKPLIDKIIPIDPIAGSTLEILGNNLPDSSDITIIIGKAKVEKYYVINEKYIKIRVPNDADSGSLHISQKKIFAPDFNLYYPIISIQHMKSTLTILLEDIRVKNDDFSLLFSLLNTSKELLTINDIRLEVIAAEDNGTPNYLQERIDLGIVSIFDQKEINKSFNVLTQKSVSLIDEKKIYKIESNSSESFCLKIDNSKKEHNIKFVFVISAQYFTNEGKTGKVYAGRFFNINSEINKGFSSFGNLPLDKASLNVMVAKYGQYIQNIKDIKACIQESR